MPFHLIFVLAITLIDAPQDRGADCPTAQACQALALEAGERQDFEAFHDLAWRAIRKGRPNDPELMRTLARAQSLSGRPLDSLVMLERMLALGITTDAATNDDFRRVRALPGWPDFEKRVEELAARTSAAAAARATAPGAESSAKPGTPVPMTRRRPSRFLRGLQRPAREDAARLGRPRMLRPRRRRLPSNQSQPLRVMPRTRFASPRSPSLRPVLPTIAYRTASSSGIEMPAS